MVKNEPFHVGGIKRQLSEVVVVGRIRSTSAGDGRVRLKEVGIPGDVFGNRPQERIP